MGANQSKGSLWTCEGTSEKGRTMRVTSRAELSSWETKHGEKYTATECEPPGGLYVGSVGLVLVD